MALFNYTQMKLCIKKHRKKVESICIGHNNQFAKPWVSDVLYFFINIKCISAL